jgi:MoxR-like ATPase
MPTKLTEEGELRKKVWKIINLIQANQLFVHSQNLEIKFLNEESQKIKVKTLSEILTICILNALVPNSAMFLIGGHGGGKTTICKVLGRMFTGNSLDEIEHSIIRGHPQLTEEKLVGTLKLGKLIHDGEEEVIWRQFILNFWKIIDEVNRLTPYAQDILLSLLAEGTVKYYDSITNISKYCLYATINPQDVGTFE